MAHDRLPHWHGAVNARDLGGIPTRDGRLTRVGALVRAGSLDGLDAAGWAEVERYGVRTVVDLRNAGEIEGVPGGRPGSIKTVNVPLDVSEDREFWGEWESGPQFGTPLYYRPHLERFAERSAEVVRTIARARPGGVVFHCAGGRDRSGQIAMLVLTLVGVEPEEIASDYVLSVESAGQIEAGKGGKHLTPEEYLRQQGTSASRVLVETVTGLDLEATLAAGGLSGADLEALRSRFLAPAV